MISNFESIIYHITIRFLLLLLHAPPYSRFDTLADAECGYLIARSSWQSDAIEKKPYEDDPCHVATVPDHLHQSQRE
jgi:hypothetical protein